MKICAVNSSLVPAFRELGHEVLHLHPEPGLNSLTHLLEGKNFTPDLIFQQEALAKRVLLSDLDAVPCPRIFWSVDTHLNLWWHGRYGQAFDLVLTTQDHLVEPLRAMGVARAGHLPWFGREHPFAPWTERPRDMVFVGRVTDQRKNRAWMLEFLSERFDLEHRDDVPYSGMTETCGRGRLAPNESILGEVNFRLFEAASAGCAVLNQTVDGDVSLLFEPGRELAECHDVLELEDQARHLLRHPSQAEAMGRAAWERVRREHLAAHRAGAVIQAASDLPRSRTNDQRDAAWRLGVALAFVAGLAPMPVQVALDLLRQRSDDPEVLAMLLRLTAEMGDRARVAAMVKPLLEAGTRADKSSLELDMAASMAALRIDWADAAARLLERRKGLRPGRGPKDRRGILLAWADLLEAQGRGMRHGFPFENGKHLPATSFECIMSAGYESMDEDAARRLSRLARPQRGLEVLHMAALSTLTLHHPDDWRPGLDLALVQLRAFRRDQGLQELAMALDKARDAGQEDHFMDRLKNYGPGAVRALLAITRPRRPGPSPTP